LVDQWDDEYAEMTGNSSWFDLTHVLLEEQANNNTTDQVKLEDTISSVSNNDILQGALRRSLVSIVL
jgi:hypothetical protein